MVGFFSIDHIAEALDTLAESGVIENYEDLSEIPIVGLALTEQGGWIEILTPGGVVRFQIEISSASGSEIAVGSRH